MSLIKFLLSQLLVILNKMYNQWQQGIMQRSESCMKASGHEQERTRFVSLSFGQWISVVKNICYITQSPPLISLSMSF